MISKRRDDKGRVLQQGEWQEPSGRYRYKYTDSLGKRKILYSWRLTEADKMPEGKRADLSLREKERKVQSLQMQGITGSNITVLELVERYLSLKTGVKHNTHAIQSQHGGVWWSISISSIAKGLVVFAWFVVVLHRCTRDGDLEVPRFIR